MVEASAARVAYSYIRFSDKKQARGDSLRRQKQLAEACCARRGWTLCEATYRDLGVSAFRGKNAIAGNLGEFLRAVTSGTVQPGSVLIVESFDRISRQGIELGMEVIQAILKSGVHIVTLTPEREYDRKTLNSTFALAEIHMTLERAAEESERKSERVHEAHQAKQTKVRQGKDGVIFSPQLPAWCKLEGDRVVLDEPKAEAIRLIFTLATQGYGAHRIASKLNKDGVPAIGGKLPYWEKGYIRRILAERRVLGEWQPRCVDHTHPKGKTKVDGEPIPNYYPAVVTEEQYYAARAGIQQRRGKGRGRPPCDGAINIFAGILKDAISGDPMVLRNRCRPNGRRYHNLTNSRATKGAGPFLSFPYTEFETLILSKLREIDPAELECGDTSSSGARLASHIATLEAELADVEGRIDFLQKEMDENGESKLLYKRLRQMETKLVEVEDRLNKARMQAATPISQSWSEATSLMDLLGKAKDPTDARLRLRSALGRVVDDARILIVPRGLVRLARVQFYFTDGMIRSYELAWRPAHVVGGRQYAGAMYVETLKHIEARQSTEYWAPLELRNVEEALFVQRELQELPTDLIEQMLGELGKPPP